MSYTEACLRCTTPKPSETKKSASCAYSLANASRSASSLEFSRPSKRTFSSSKTCPDSRAAACFLASSPTVSFARTTSCPSSSPSRLATGARENSGFTCPFGRPRCAITTTFALASTRALRVGNAARIRPSSVILPSCNGTLKSERTRTLRPVKSPKDSISLRAII